MRERLRYALPAVISLLLFIAALEVLRVELHSVSWRDIVADVRATPWPRLAAALALTAVNYTILTGYDLLAFRYIGRPLPAMQIASAAFLAYAISNNVGFSVLSGASVRYRFYSRWGISGEDLSRIVFSNSITFWLGLLVLGGASGLLIAQPADVNGAVRTALPILGAAMTLAVVAFLGATAAGVGPLRIRGVALPLPSLSIASQQLVISTIDWALAGTVLYVLLPPTSLTLLGFLGSFFVAILLGMVSHVPGGVGVFEGSMILLLKPYLPSGDLLPALVVYRAVYYLLPFGVALAALVVDEVRQRRAHVARAGAWLGRMTEMLTPRVLATCTFLSGMLLLVSGATPAAPGRLDVLDRLLPLGVVEASHFIGSVVGAALLILSHGLSRRLDGAYYLAVPLIVVGMGASLLKGFDYEEAVLLAVVLIALRRSRPAFDRRAAFLEATFSAWWLAAVAGAIGASIWLTLFAFKHVGYANQLWWQFELSGEASRSMRAAVGAALVVLLATIARLLRPAPHEAEEPSEDDLALAGQIVAAQASTTPNLAFLRDKALMFSEDRRGFLMYAVQGRTWLAMSDPAGPVEVMSPLIRSFLERCDDFDGTPAFYEIGPEHLHRYADFGMTFVKLGEEAKVNLDAFTLEGGDMARLRQSFKRLEKEQASFRVVPVELVPALLQEFRRVSDDWLADKGAAEKGFSLGFFDEEYIRRFPVAVIERAGRVVAFANLWSGAPGGELSVDLMRYHRDAPKGVMESLFVHVLAWGKAQGYSRFSLGMAPLSGFEASPVASFWNRIGALLYEHGEAMYNFQGLRAFKEKFHPTWEPRYLAYPGGLSLPRILADASALIAGGYRKLLPAPRIPARRDRD